MKFLAIVFLFASCSGFAQDSAKDRACNTKATTQSELNVCASEEAARADTELNEVYRKLLSLATKQQGAVEKVNAAERAWIIYRDAYIAAMYPADDKQATYGTMFPMEANYLRASLTRQQIAALNDLIKQYDEIEP